MTVAAPPIPSLTTEPGAALAPTGNLADIRFPSLLVTLALEGRTTLLELEHGPVRKTVVLESGVPVDCRSNLLGDTLRAYLVRAGRLSEEESGIILAESASTGVTFGQVLQEQGKITASELYRVLQQQLARKLLDLFTWREGRYRLLAMSRPSESALKIKVAQLVILGITRFAEEKEIATAVAPLVGQTLYLDPDAAFPLDGLQLGDETERMLGVLEEGARIDQIATHLGASHERIMRLIHALVAVRAVTMTEPEVSVEPDAEDDPPDLETVRLPPVVVTPLGVTQSLPKPAPAEPDPEFREREREHFMDLYLRHRRLDGFDLLEISTDATVAAIDDAYMVASRRVAPWHLAEIGLGELEDQAREVFLAMARAYGELSDGERRNSLIARRNNLLGGRSSGAARDAVRIRTDLLDARKQFQKGVAYLQRGNYDEARQQLQFAVDCESQNALYLAELARCQFLGAPETGWSNALEQLNRAIELDPELAVARLYKGQLLASRGDFDPAEEELKIAAKAMLPDRRGLEALNSMRAERKKPRRRRR